jgi:mxaJ protein
MCSASNATRRHGLFVAGLLALLAAANASGRPVAAPAGGDPSSVLRVCADPNNLPYSNARGEGFENALARLLADNLHRSLAYTWFPQRRGFIRNTLRAGKCDVVMGVPTRMEMVRTTVPYYRSSYVFVTRRSRHLDISSFDDPRLRTLRIGVHAVGDDYANVPPAIALARRGIVDNLHGYSIYGDYSKPSPPRALIDAVANGKIDVAIAWGPFAGYFAQLESAPLSIHPVQGITDPALAMRYDISMGVRKDDVSMQQALNAFIAQDRNAIDHVLARYGIPQVPGGAPSTIGGAP